MAGRNGAGPLGIGPMIGRGLGPCGGGYFSRRPRFGRRSGYYNPYLNEPYPMDESMEKSIIKEEKAILEARLKELNNILDKDED